MGKINSIKFNTDNANMTREDTSSLEAQKKSSLHNKEWPSILYIPLK